MVQTIGSNTLVQLRAQMCKAPRVRRVIVFDLTLSIEWSLGAGVPDAYALQGGRVIAATTLAAR